MHELKTRIADFVAGLAPRSEPLTLRQFWTLRAVLAAELGAHPDDVGSLLSVAVDRRFGSVIGGDVDFGGGL